MKISAVTYVGQVEQDPQGALWAVLYYRDQVLSREQVTSLRMAKRRVSDLVISAADNYPAGPLQATEPTPGPQVALAARSGDIHRAAIPHLV